MMNFNFFTTISKKEFLLTDADDDDAPLLSFCFHNEFNTKLTLEQKKLIAEGYLRASAQFCEFFIGAEERMNESRTTDNP